MFYEEKHSANNDHFQLSRQEIVDFKFPLHLHKSYEFIYVTEGLLQVAIGDHTFDVMAGEYAFILPNQPHGYDTPNFSRSKIGIFSPDYIPELARLTAEVTPFHPIIKRARPSLYDELLCAEASPLRVRSVLYELAALYAEGESAPYLAVTDGELVCRIVKYIEAHYAEPMSLEDLARALGYSYRYMSGVVNRFFKLPLPKVVNRYRVNYACKMLSGTNTEITEVALLCGFGSMRNFNRCFKMITGLSPREYRKEKSS